MHKQLFQIKKKYLLIFKGENWMKKITHTPCKRIYLVSKLVMEKRAVLWCCHILQDSKLSIHPSISRIIMQIKKCKEKESWFYEIFQISRPTHIACPNTVSILDKINKNQIAQKTQRLLQLNNVYPTICPINFQNSL